MKTIIRGRVVLLLALGVVFGGVACSVSTSASKISKADIGKLNAANTNVRTPFEELDWESAQCPSSLDSPSRNKKCEAALLRRYVSDQRAAASVYEQVAASAPGACQKALRRVAYDIRGNTEFLSGGSEWATGKEMKKDRDAMIKACKLKVEKPKK